METKKVTVQTTVHAKPYKVWNCWTQPRHITKWNFASDDWHCPKAENEIRAGGKMNWRMEAKDGSFGFDFEAIYNEVKNQQKITYTMTDGRMAITDFEVMGDKTKVTTTFDAENQNPVDMQRDGWQSILNNFKKYVEGNFTE